MTKIIQSIVKGKPVIIYPRPVSAFYTSKETGLPVGGKTTAIGLMIDWQSGPVIDGNPNGAFLETVIQAAEDRLNFYQTTKMACVENDRALEYLRLAREELIGRTKTRLAQGIEGTPAPHMRPEQKKRHEDHEQNFGA